MDDFAQRRELIRIRANKRLEEQDVPWPRKSPGGGSAVVGILAAMGVATQVVRAFLSFSFPAALFLVGGVGVLMTGLYIAANRSSRVKRWVSLESFQVTPRAFYPGESITIQLEVAAVRSV